jgi:hypothetical protein
VSRLGQAFDWAALAFGLCSVIYLVAIRAYWVAGINTLWVAVQVRSMWRRYGATP